MKKRFFSIVMFALALMTVVAMKTMMVDPGDPDNPEPKTISYKI